MATPRGGNKPINRGYQANAQTQIDLVKNTILAKPQKILLERPFGPIIDPRGVKNKIEADIEGGLNIPHSLFGLPVWDIITLTYLPEFLDYTFSIAMIEVTNQKNVIQTAVQGLNSTIKEYINNSDYSIRITASVVGNAQDYYPHKDISTINDICNISDSIQIYSKILNKYFGVNDIVILGCKVFQPELGQRNVQQVEIDCVSDDPSVYKLILSA